MGTKRTIDSGRTDKLGRKIKESGTSAARQNTAQQRMDQLSGSSGAPVDPEVEMMGDVLEFEGIDPKWAAVIHAANQDVTTYDPGMFRFDADGSGFRDFTRSCQIVGEPEVLAAHIQSAPEGKFTRDEYKDLIADQNPEVAAAILDRDELHPDLRFTMFLRGTSQVQSLVVAAEDSALNLQLLADKGADPGAVCANKSTSTETLRSLVDAPGCADLIVNHPNCTADVVQDMLSSSKEDSRAAALSVTTDEIAVRRALKSGTDLEKAAAKARLGKK